MINGLENHIANIINGTLEERIAEAKGITLAEAKKLVKNASFMEYVRLQEANPTPTGGSQSPPQQPIRQNDARRDNESPFNDKNMIDMTKRNLLKPGAEASFGDRPGIVKAIAGNRVTMDMGDGSETSVDLTKLSGPLVQDSSNGSMFSDDNGYDDGESALGKLAANAKAGFQTGLSDDIDQVELNRLRELAGIEETSSAGGTCAGGIATMPSIIGDTSDSHKPTNKLKTKNRLKREERKRKEKSGRE